MRSELSIRDEVTAHGVSGVSAVDVRVVLLTVSGGQLLTGVVPKPWPSLPRLTPHAEESLDVTSRRVIRDVAGIQEQYLEQLYTFSVTPVGKPRSIIVSYLALICSSPQLAPGGSIEWVESGARLALSPRDRMVLDYAVFRLRAKLSYTTIAFHLLPETFTLTELQQAYEAVLGQQLDKRNFRRRMIAAKIVVETTAKRRDGSHRPATLYSFSAEHDAAAYLTPAWAVAAEGTPAR